MYKEILKKGVKIKIIGDSLASGAGSSMSYLTQDLIFGDEGTKFLEEWHPTVGGGY